MKKLFCVVLVLLLVFGLFGCAGTGTTAPTTQPAAELWLEAGFARVDVTPGFNVGLDGSGNAATRISQGVADNLTVTCVAMRAEETTVLVYTADTLGFNNTLLNQFRPLLEVATNVPQSNIFLGATHTHSAPRLLLKTEEGKQYLSLFSDALVAAGQMAISDLAPATLQAATTDLPGMNFVRHYKMADGSYAGPNFGKLSGADIVDYAGTVDPELSMIKLDRSGDQKDILMLNWQAHPNNSSALGYYLISADFVGKLRNKLEADTGMQVAYYTGASGNVHIDSEIESDAHNLPWDAYGEKMAELTQQALPLLQNVGGTGIEVAQTKYVATIDHTWDPMVAQAQEVMNVVGTVGTSAAANLCETYGFTSHHQARTIIERSKLGSILQCDLPAFRVGDVGFANYPYEMWAESGKYVKDNSPFDVTFVITCNIIYTPMEYAFEYRSYEADTSYFVKGTAEKLADEYVAMLNSLK